MEELIFSLAFTAVLGIVLTIGGLVVDYIFPRCKRLNKYIDQLPLIREDKRNGKQ